MRSSALPAMLTGPIATEQGAPLHARSADAKSERRTTQLQHGKRIYAARRGDRLRLTKSSHGRATFMKRLSILAAGLVIGAAALQFSSVASGQSDGWVTLVDGTK